MYNGAQAYGRRAVAAAGAWRRRGSVGAGHAGGASRVAELGARHAAAADDAVRQPALRFLRPRIRLRDQLAGLESLKQQLPQYVSAAANVPSFNKGSVADYSNAILGWWRTNGTSFPAWALAARIVFASSPNSASCERVFALLRNLFGELQMRSLADYVQAALMLNYNQRNVG